MGADKKCIGRILGRWTISSSGLNVDDIGVFQSERVGSWVENLSRKAKI